jgi:hypothetical protein
MKYMLIMLSLFGASFTAHASRDAVLVIDSGIPAFQPNVRAPLVSALAQREGAERVQLFVTGNPPQDQAQIESFIERARKDDLRFSQVILDGSAFQMEALQGLVSPSVVKAAHATLDAVSPYLAAAPRIWVPVTDRLSRDSAAAYIIPQIVRETLSLQQGEIILIGAREGGLHLGKLTNQAASLSFVVKDGALQKPRFIGRKAGLPLPIRRDQIRQAKIAFTAPHRP